MIESKTSVLFRIGIRFLSEIYVLDELQKNHLLNFVNSIGNSFQIVDDLLNLTSLEYSQGKGGLGEDITEGKLSLMAVHHLNQKDIPISKSSEEPELISIFKKSTKDPELISKAITLMKNSGSLDYAQQRSVELMKDSWNSIDKVLVQNEFREDMRLLLGYIVNRQI